MANSISIMNAQFIEDLALTTMEEMSTWMQSGESNPDPNALERPQLIFDARGTPVTLLCAGAYTSDRTRSFNVAIPLRRPA